MNLKSAVIAAAALAVAAFALYLFFQVRATPARANATQVTQRETSHRKPATPTPPPTEDPAKEPAKEMSKLRQLPDRKAEMGREVDGPPPPTVVDDTKAALKQDNLMELANKAYDGQDFEQATAIAQKVLVKDPTNVRMLRILVSANCIQGDSVIAQQAYEKLPKADREQMQTRCDRYGVSFKEPAQ